MIGIIRQAELTDRPPGCIVQKGVGESRWVVEPVGERRSGNLVATRPGRGGRVQLGGGYLDAPAAAKMRIVSERLGEERVSRTWRYQGSRPVVIDRVLYETTGDRLEARDLETDQLLWRWDDARSEAGERRLSHSCAGPGKDSKTERT